MYVFVILNKPGVQCRYFVVWGAALLERANIVACLDDPEFAGIRSRDLVEFEDNWSLFDETQQP